MSLSLVRVLTNPDHGDALRRFLRLWYGVELPAVEATPQVPALLGSLLALNHSDNRITPFLKLLEPKEVADGLLTFASEYEGVDHWAYRPGESDPIVWGCFPEWEDPWAGTQPIWPPEHERHQHSRLSEFLIELCVFNAIWMSPPLELRTTPPAVLPRDLGRLEPVLGAWHWPEYPSRFVSSDRGLGFAYPPREEEPVRELILMLTEHDLGGVPAN